MIVRSYLDHLQLFLPQVASLTKHKCTVLVDNCFTYVILCSLKKKEKKRSNWSQGDGEEEIRTSNLCFMKRGPQPIELPIGVLLSYVPIKWTQ
jgi:hypothetical protein